MKRSMVLLLLACLLLCGCGGTAPAPTTEPVQIQTQPQATTEPTEIQTEAATDPAQTESYTEPYDVTVYLLEEIVYSDSRRMEYIYDDCLNLVQENTWDIEDNLLCVTYYEDFDACGMPQRARVEWDYGETYNMIYTYDEEGRLLSQFQEGFADSGIEYIYDDLGMLTEKRSFYEGEVYETTYIEYAEGVLSKVWRVDQDGVIGFEAFIEDGRIVKKHYPDPNYESSLLYRYDERGLLIARDLEEYGEIYPNVTYHYTEAIADSRRATYMQKLQDMLLDII